MTPRNARTALAALALALAPLGQADAANRTGIASSTAAAYEARTIDEPTDGFVAMRVAILQGMRPGTGRRPANPGSATGGGSDAMDVRTPRNAGATGTTDTSGIGSDDPSWHDDMVVEPRGRAEGAR